MSQIEFLETQATTERLKQLIQSEKKAWLAVAYWGYGATKNLGLHNGGKPIRVLCDLFSGSCRPSEIINLIKAGVEVRTKDNLHAKVYGFPNDVVIGSSNASANGLGFEGAQLAGNAEANAWIRDKAFVSSARKWFDIIWKPATKVTEEMAKDAMPIWREHQQSRHRLSSGKTLLTALAKKPQSFKTRKIMILAFIEGDVDKAFDETFKTVSGSYSQQTLAALGDEDPWYADTTGWKVCPGTFILDYRPSDYGTLPKSYGIWRVRDKPIVKVKIPSQPKARMILLDHVADYEGLRFPVAEQRVLGQVLKSCLPKAAVNEKNLRKNHYNLYWETLYDFWEKNAEPIRKKMEKKGIVM